MNKKLLFLLFLLSIFIFFNCQKNNSEKSAKLEKINSEIIERQTMVELLTQFYMIEGKIFSSPQEIDKRDLTKSLYSHLFEKYDIEDQQFIQSVEYYLLKDSVTANSLLNEVTIKLEQHKDSIQRIVEP